MLLFAFTLNVLLNQLADATSCDCVECICPQGDPGQGPPDGGATDDDEGDAKEDDEWKDFKDTFGKEYADAAEEELRRGIWKESKTKIEEHNRDAANGKYTYTLGFNPLADRTDEEFVKLLGTRRPPEEKSTLPQDDDDYYEDEKTLDCENLKKADDFLKSVPRFKDWRRARLVTPVKDQGPDGTCYAFAAAGAIESQFLRFNGRTKDLSEQQIVDCSKDYGNGGSKGGMPYLALSYVIDNGIATEDDYPYVGQDQNCNKDAESDITIEGCVRLPEYDEAYLQAAVGKKGPIAVVMDVHKSIKLYKDGIYEEPGCTDPDNYNHALLVIGYGREAQQDYWLIKNSWGVDWGLNGFFKLARNKNNMCSIATESVLPIVVDPLSVQHLHGCDSGASDDHKCQHAC
jgi:cathepsin L